MNRPLAIGATENIALASEAFVRDVKEKLGAQGI